MCFRVMQCNLSNLSEFVSGDLKLVSGLLGAVSCLLQMVLAWFVIINAQHSSNESYFKIYFKCLKYVCMSDKNKTRSVADTV